jgi:trigger factor
VNPTDTQDACKREIQVEVPAAVVAQETETLVEKFQKLARIPGFRRGKVPATIIRQRFGDDIKNEVMENLMPRYIREAADKQGLTMVSTPRVSDVDFKPGEPLRFKASFEVLPQVEVSGYQELRAEKADVSVSDEDVDQALNNIREQHATYTPVEDRPLQDGDYAQASFHGVPKDQPAGAGQPAPKPGSKPVNVDDVMVEIGGANTVREFSDNLRGARPGEERTFDVTYRDDFSDQRLAGKTMTYTVQVKGIKNKQLPVLDDAFARELGSSFENLDAVKQHIRQSLEQDKQRTAEREAKDKMVDELVRRHDFPVPEALVERQVDVRLERGLRALAAQGMRPEDMKRMDFSRLRAGQREAATREVKASLLLEKIADAEHIEVSEDEVNQELEALAAQSKQPLEAVRQRLTREGVLDRIRHRIRSEKTLDFLYRQSA